MITPGQSNTQFRQSTQRTCVISSVDMANNKIAVVDQHGSTLNISLDALDPFFAVPQTNERWVIDRVGNLWYLVRRYELAPQMTAIQSLQPGDRRIEANNDLYLNASGTINITGQTILVNGKNLMDLFP